ncbi:MAG TPA: flagellar biosynthetic protein FliR [Clostridiales bacterium UBA8153]|nr:flagellar biosynthetic protein FliR [Clostridiales bacterium UBA8153]
MAEDLTHMALVSMRVMGVLAAGPVWSSRYLYWPVRALLAVYTGVALAPVVARAPLTQGAGLLLSAGRELATGLALGFMAGLVFSAVQVAGHLIDMETGFGIVNVLDPNLGQPAPVVGSFLYLLAMLVFLSLNGHHLLLMALADSFQVVPVDSALWGGGSLRVVVDASGEMFWIALRIALPVVGALFVGSVALGLVARSVPQLNIFVVGLPAKLAGGLLLLSLAMPAYVLMVEVLARDSHRHTMALLRLMR